MMLLWLYIGCITRSGIMGTLRLRENLGAAANFGIHYSSIILFLSMWPRHLMWAHLTMWLRSMRARSSMWAPSWVVRKRVLLPAEVPDLSLEVSQPSDESSSGSYNHYFFLSISDVGTIFSCLFFFFNFKFMLEPLNLSGRMCNVLWFF